MRVDFEYIKFRNFGSYGNNFTQYNFTTGLYNLFGAIGQGKSTVLSALYFCLYGKTFKVNISELINDVNESELETECKFSIGLDKYIVKRGLKPGYITVTILMTESWFSLPTMHPRQRRLPILLMQQTSGSST